MAGVTRPSTPVEDISQSLKIDLPLSMSPQISTGLPEEPPSIGQSTSYIRGTISTFQDSLDTTQSADSEENFDKYLKKHPNYIASQKDYPPTLTTTGSMSSAPEHVPSLPALSKIGHPTTSTKSPPGTQGYSDQDFDEYLRKNPNFVARKDDNPPTFTTSCSRSTLSSSPLKTLHKENGDKKTRLKGQFPHIEGGLNDGLVEYWKDPQRRMVRVIFILNPTFIISIPEVDAYIGVVQAHPDVAKEVNGELNGCMYLSLDQSGCRGSEKKYFCMSWVS